MIWERHGGLSLTSLADGNAVRTQPGEGRHRLRDLELYGRIVTAGTDHQRPLVLGGDFLERYRASVDFVNENVADAAQLVGNYDIVAAEVAEKAIPACNIVCITGEEMQEKLSGYLSVLMEQNPEAIGGQLPDDDFYYIQKQ